MIKTGVYLGIVNNKNNYFMSQTAIFLTDDSIEMIKALALMQYNNEPFFVDNGIAYHGEIEKDLKLRFASNWKEVTEYNMEDYDNKYIVCTNEEATEKAEQYIKDTLWAFNASFLSEQTDLPIEVFTAIQDNGKCEGNNNVIENIITKCGDMDSFIDNAIYADGRGHFISSYDGNENEQTVLVNGTTYTLYIYRMN